jgi:hypothetical protein
MPGLRQNIEWVRDSGGKTIVAHIIADEIDAPAGFVGRKTK